VFVSGLAPVNPETGGYDILPIDQQARRVLEHLKSCLEAAGSSLDRVIKCNVYCCNPSYFAAINTVYTEYFGPSNPAHLHLHGGLVRPVRYGDRLHCTCQLRRPGCLSIGSHATRWLR